MSTTDNRHYKELSRLKVLEALFEKDLSWSELRQRTGLSGNTLVARLNELKQEKLVSDSLGRGSSRRPLVIYSLSNRHRRRISEKVKPIHEILKIEGEIGEYKKTLLESSKNSPGSIREIEERYFDCIISATLYLFETVLLRKSSDGFYDSIIASETISAIRRILWMSWFARSFSDVTKQGLALDRNENLRKFRELVGESKKPNRKTAD